MSPCLPKARPISNELGPAENTVAVVDAPGYLVWLKLLLKEPNELVEVCHHGQML